MFRGGADLRGFRIASGKDTADRIIETLVDLLNHVRARQRRGAIRLLRIWERGTADPTHLTVSKNTLLMRATATSEKRLPFPRTFPALAVRFEGPDWSFARARQCRSVPQPES